MQHNPDDSIDSNGTCPTVSARVAIPLLALIAFVAIAPATAAAADPVPLQSSSTDDICSTDIPSYLSTFMELTTILGLVGLVAVWQMDTLAELLTMNPRQKRNLKQHKRSSAKSGVVLLVLGPVFSVFIRMMDVGLGSCFTYFGI